jgi:predicted P-loop ATPase
MRLTEQDYQSLEACAIPRHVALAADVHRVVSIDGRELVGRQGSGNYAGIVFPCRWPDSNDITAYRLRLDSPPLDLRTRKPQYRYLVAPGTRNRFYCPLERAADLANSEIDVWFCEGEKKYLALHAFAEKISSNGSGVPKFIPIGLFGVWGWKGVVGIASDQDGHRVSVKGVIDDFNKLNWDNHRRARILFDANAAWNESVRTARALLARELEGRGAEAYFINLPLIEGINGVDDFLARQGPEALEALVQQSLRYEWKDELMRTEKGKVIPGISAPLTAFRLAPPWHGVLVYNEFARRPEARRPPPWADGKVGPWGDHEDRKATEWLEHQGIRAGITIVGQAALTVAEEHMFHPVREYLDSLKWDGVPRIGTFTHRYLGARLDPDDRRGDYNRAASSCWFKSGPARIYEPGCKVDHVLILKGPQGGLKSTVFATLGGKFYSDDIADLGTKDAALGAAGAWIIELSELAAMTKPEIEKIKSFLSRSTDRFRPPYGRHYVEVPRQCIFGGSVNAEHFLRDDTGNRRFWPIECGEIDIEALRRDRDQLWAEAVHCYRNGEKWWLETPELIATALEEQEEAYQPDPWEPEVEKQLANLLTEKEAAAFTTIPDLLRVLHKDTEKWTRLDAARVGVILTRAGWKSTRPWVAGGGPRPRIYRPSPAALAAWKAGLLAKGASS